MVKGNAEKIHKKKEKSSVKLLVKSVKNAPKRTILLWSANPRSPLPIPSLRQREPLLQRKGQSAYWPSGRENKRSTIGNNCGSPGPLPQIHSKIPTTLNAIAAKMIIQLNRYNQPISLITYNKDTGWF